jgi:hypothetical protein
MDASTNPESSRGHIVEIDTVYDKPYQFGRRPNTPAPWPFTERQFARLLIMRSRVEAVSAAAQQPKAA